MSSEWRNYTLFDIALPGKNGLVDGPFGSNLPSSAYAPKGIPVIRGSNLSKGKVRFKGDEFVYVSNDTANALARSICIPNDIIFTKKGTLGQVGLVPTDGHSIYLLSSNQMRMRVDTEQANPTFVYYYLAQTESIEKILRDSEHTGVPKISLSYLKSFPISLPDLATQHNVANALTALDDRITLLRETNATLEAIAQALFKSWFVDFDPVHAKMQGRTPEGMDDATTALFPGALEESELGLVPVGWAYATIGEVCSLGRGSSPRPIQDFMGNDIPWIKIADATASDGMFIFKTKEKIRRDGAAKSVSVSHGDLIMSNSASCGIPVFVELQGCIHDGWLYFKNYNRTSRNLLFYWLRHISSHLVHIADGSVQKNLNIGLVSSQRILCPSQQVLSEFEVLVQPILDKVRGNCLQAQTLASLRDTLLPRLISGQLRLPETV